MKIQNQTQQIAEEEFLLPLSEDELEIIDGGFSWEGVHRVVGKIVDKAPPTQVAIFAKLYKVSALHNTEGKGWSFL